MAQPRTQLPQVLLTTLTRSYANIDTCRRSGGSRTGLFVAAFVGAGALFIGLKWNAVLARSEAAKKASTKEINYSVAPNRSGMFSFDFQLYTISARNIS